ncbi:MAG: ATP-binding protein [Candidatus Omnitrophota bacterium]
MLIHSFFLFLSSVIVSSLGMIVFVKRKKSHANLFFFLFTMAISLWQISYGIAFLPIPHELIFFFFKIGYAGITFIPLFWLFFVLAFLNQTRVLKSLSWPSIAIAVLWIFSIAFLNLPIVSLFHYPWGAYPKVNIIAHIFFLTYFYGLFTTSMIFLGLDVFFSKKFHKDLGAIRSRYVLGATIVGVFAAIDFTPNYGLNIYPFGFIFMLAFSAVTFYSIIKYRLMDVSIVITRTTIFIFVYSLVLGIPYFFAFSLQEWLKAFLGDTWWLSPLILLTVLATAGPFIYMAIQRKAEEKLFQDQRRYQATLRQAATGMGRIKDMEKLIGMIVHIVTRSVRIEHSVIFLKEPGGKKYKFEGARSRHKMKWEVKELDTRSPIIRALNKVQQPIVYSELKQRALDSPDAKFDEVARQMELLHAELVIPSFIDENLIAFMVLGRKLSGELYSDDDISVFSILASQAALAIENCQFYRDMRATHEQLFQAEKMATIGIMADGLSHQINNRLHALGFIAGDALDTICMKKDLPMSGAIKDVMVDLEHALTRIQENVTQGGEIVRGLLKYSRKQDETLSEVDLDELIDEAFKMAQFKIKKDAMDLITDFPRGLPKIKGNFTELQEVFFNLFDNAYDAMMQRKEELKEEGYRPTIKITAELHAPKWIHILIRDNGIGIKAEDQVKIFTPFFTTKLSSKKGTGLGLYVIRKLIEENHKGKVIYRSEYMKGTRVYVMLPAC